MIAYREASSCLLNRCRIIGKLSILVVSSRERKLFTIETIELKLAMPMLAAFAECDVKYSLYDKVVPNPTTKECEEARTMYINDGCDCLVAIGGGSSLDCAKAVGARIARPKKQLSKMEGILKIRKKPRIVLRTPKAVPTLVLRRVMPLLPPAMVKRSFLLPKLMSWSCYLKKLSSKKAHWPKLTL